MSRGEIDRRSTITAVSRTSLVELRNVDGDDYLLVQIGRRLKCTPFNRRAHRIADADNSKHEVAIRSVRWP